MELFQINRALPYAPYVNNSIKENIGMSEAALQNQDVSAYPGDPLSGANVPPAGVPFGASGITWDTATFVQACIYEWSQTEGIPVQDADYITNPGPSDASWNKSYAQRGFTPSTPGGTKKAS